MSANDWLAYATRFTFGQTDSDEGIRIEGRHNRKNEIQWGVFRYGTCLNSDGEWEYEPLPSSRTDEYFARTRLATKEEALDRACKFLPEFTAAAIKAELCL